MSDVKIKLFGKFEITSDGKLVLGQLNQTRKTNLFIQYLILQQGAPVSHEEILSTLWSDRESGSPATALRTLLHRYRVTVEQSGITQLQNSVITTRGFYQWNAGLDCQVDIYEFTRLFQIMRDARCSLKERIDSGLQVLELYRGPLLGGGSEEMWIVQKSVYYHDRFIECMLLLIELLKEEKDQDAIIRVCRRAQEVDLFDERLQIELMLALSKTGSEQGAANQYYFINELAGKQLGIETPSGLREIYQRMVKADSQLDQEIDAVYAMLGTTDKLQGPFVCAYEILGDIYQIQHRIVARSNSMIFLGLCSITCLEGNDPDNLVMEQAMQELLEILKKNLRRGDTVARRGLFQYVLLLPAAAYENARSALERIRTKFAENTNKNLRIKYKLRPLFSGSDNTGMQTPTESSTAYIKKTRTRKQRTK